MNAILATIFTESGRSGDKEAGADPDRDLRLKHITCAALLLSRRFPPANVAALFGIGRATAYEWRDRALAYDDAEAVGLRRLVGRG